MKPRGDSSVSVFLSSYQKINEEPITWCSLKRWEKHAHICRLSWQSRTTSSRCWWNTWLCMRSPSHGNGQFTTNRGFVLAKSRLRCALFSLNHQAFIISLIFRHLKAVTVTWICGASYKLNTFTTCSSEMAEIKHAFWDRRRLNWLDLCSRRRWLG